MKQQIESGTPFCVVADEAIDRLAERKFFGIKTNEEAVERLEQEVRKLKDQLKLVEKRVKSVSGCVITKDSFGLAAFLPKVEDVFRDLTALSVQATALVRKWSKREREK